MNITPQFNAEQITRMIAVKEQRLETAILNRLTRIGEQFVTNARSTDTYKDRTGNLRSSIGYLVLKNGEQLTSNGFEQVKQGSTGTETGKQFIETIATRYPTGLVLIVVAGMSYAAAVESKGFDVLTGSGQLATNALRQAIETLKAKA